MLKNLKLGQKLMLSFLLVAVLSCVSGIVASIGMSYVDSGYSNALLNFGFAQGDIGQAMLQIAQGQADTVKIVSYTEQDDINKAIQDISDCQSKYMKLVETVRETLSDENAQKIFSKIESLTDQYIALRDELIELGNTTDAEISHQTQLRLESELDPLYQEFYGTWQELAEYKSTKGDGESDHMSALSQTLLFVSITLCIVGVGIAAVLGVILSRSISRPIRESAQRLIAFSKGDLQSPVPQATSNDETKELIDATGETIGKLNRVISDIGYLLGEMGHGNFDVDTKDADAYVGDLSAVLTSLHDVNNAVNDALLQVDTAVEQVNAGGEQVSNGAQALAQGATEQASSVQELAATIDTISHQVNTTAEHAKTAEAENRRSGEALDTCSTHMNELVAAMRSIDDKSKEIGNVIKTIEDIAFQTNILALNAAVEAARAGAAGKGFAVVADEVRNLATKSQEAAKSTTALIDETVKAVSEGTRLSGETDEALKLVVASSQKVLDAVTLISSATSEEANAIAQVSTGIDQISSVVQTNSATAEESAAASEELSGQANLLHELVGKFRLHKDSHFATYPSVATHPPVATHSSVDSFHHSGGDKY